MPIDDWHEVLVRGPQPNERFTDYLAGMSVNVFQGEPDTVFKRMRRLNLPDEMIWKLVKGMDGHDE